MQRRQFLTALSALSLATIGYGASWWWCEDLSETGIMNPCLLGLPNEITAHPLYKRIFENIDFEQVWDCHVHLVGTGDANTGIWFNPEMDSWQHPVLKLQKKFYMNAGCAVSGAIDHSFANRLASIADQMPIGFKAMLFAFEWCHDEQGRPDQQHSIFHIPNVYAASIAAAYPTRFEWVASIHPYRPDAIDTLQWAKAHGARAIKWLPSAMNIDPSSPRCDRFYQEVSALSLPIITHTGRESAVQGGLQDYANPLHMRRALDYGIKVALAHCASDGSDIDLDSPAKTRIPSFELFSRLMDTPDYQSNLYGEISAITLRNHAWVIPELLRRQEWHHRLLNGSDYPLSAIMPLTDVHLLQRQGLLDESSVPFLVSIKSHNSLLFDFALKRLLRYEDYHWPKTVFETRPFFEAIT